MNLLTPSHVLESTGMTPTYSPASLALSLVGDIRSLGLVSHQDAPLKNFSKRILTCIRSIDDAVEIEEFRGHQFLNLISRLNQEVAPYLLQQELPFSNSEPLHIWVIDQAHLLSTEQQSIIFRLIELFPGLPFRVIWLSNQPLQSWKQHSQTECIFLDLDAVDSGPMHWEDPTLVAEPNDALLAGEPSPDASPGNALKWPGPKLSQQLKVGAVGLGVLLLAGLAWMGSSSPTPPAVVTAASEPAVAAPAMPVSEAPAPAVPPAPAPIAATSEPSAKPSPAEALDKSSNKALPEVARTGARWLKALPADTLVVEHGTFKSVEQAQKLKAKHKELVNARIVATRKSSGADEWQFTVVTGPFRSEERAKSYVSRLDWRASTRIRSTDKLKPLVASAP
jgi:hypothetical protein